MFVTQNGFSKSQTAPITVSLTGTANQDDMKEYILWNMNKTYLVIASSDLEKFEISIKEYFF